MPRFEFRMDPAWVSVSEGLSLAFRHWRSTAAWWAIPILVVGIIATIFYWGLEAAILGSIDQFVPVIDPSDPYAAYATPDLGAMFGAMLPQFLATTLGLGVIIMVVRWVYYALAITGLRGGEVTAAMVVGRGLRALVADLALTLVYVALVAGVILITGAAGGIGIIVAIVAGVGLVYLQVRLAFWTLAIFDGAGIAEAFAASMRASEGAVLRMIGWALAVGGVGFLANIGAAIVTFPIADAVPLQSGVKAGFTEAFAVFQVFALAVLYESQLRRNLPERASPPPAGYVEPTRAWPGYAPVSPGYPGAPGYQAPGRPVPPWPSAPEAPSSSSPAATPQDAAAIGPAWDEPPVNPDAPATWDPKPIDAAPGTDPGAEPGPPRPPAPPAG